MVLKKNLINDLKKSNDELDFYLEDLNLNQIPIDKIIKTNSSSDVDYLNIIGSSVVDLRTEVALMRKNLVNDVELIVLDSIKNSQTEFFNQQNELQAKLLFEIKENFANYIKELSGEISEIKLELKKKSLKEEQFFNTILNLNKDLLILSSQIKNIEETQIKTITPNKISFNSNKDILNSNLNINSSNNIISKSDQFNNDPIEEGISNLISNESVNVLRIEKRLKKLDTLK